MRKFTEEEIKEKAKGNQPLYIVSQEPECDEVYVVAVTEEDGKYWQIKYSVSLSSPMGAIIAYDQEAPEVERYLENSYIERWVIKED